MPLNRSSQPTTRASKYIFYYNLFSSFLWCLVLLRLLILLPLVGRRFLPGGIAEFFQVVASIPSVELLHSLNGITKQKVGATIFAKGSVLVIIWLVIFSFPKVARHTAYSIFITTMSIDNSIKYGYYAYRLKSRGPVPGWLKWLKYNKFIILYPISVAAEMCLIFISLQFADDFDQRYAFGLRVLIVLYIPTFYMLYNYKFTKRDTAMAPRRGSN